VLFDRGPQKVLRRVDGELRARLLARAHELELDPRPPGVEKLASYRNLYRLRVGDWRIIYVVKEDQLLILAIEIAPRGGAYRDLR
jgi:mRNA interferase RelE/StbE